jgi:integrase
LFGDLTTAIRIWPYPTNLVSRMLYGCGLRVSEPLNLRIKDVDLGAGSAFGTFGANPHSAAVKIEQLDLRLAKT